MTNDNITKQDLLDLEKRLIATMTAKMERLETNLLSAFQGWARSMDVRVRVLSSGASLIDERLSLLEVEPLLGPGLLNVLQAHPWIDHARPPFWTAQRSRELITYNAVIISHWGGG